MSKMFIGFLICFLILNCGKKDEKQIAKNKAYVISYEDKKLQKYVDSLKESSGKKVLFPRKGFYGEHQLLIDKKGNLYFYQKEYYREFCSYGNQNDTLPHLLFLKQKTLLESLKKV